MVRVDAVGYMCKEDATISQSNPVSGTQYEVLATTQKVRIISIEASVTWTGQPTPLEVHATIDGVTHKWSFTNPVSTTAYHCRMRESTAQDNQIMEANSYAQYRPFLLDGKSVQIKAETTGGTVQTLYCRVRYAVLRP